MIDILKLPWRIGHKLGRTVYAMVGDTPSDDDIFLGLIDWKDWAVFIVEEHNRNLKETS